MNVEKKPIPQILKDAKMMADALKAQKTKWKLIEINESGKKPDPVYGLAWENLETKERMPLKMAYNHMKFPVVDKPPAKKKETSKDK